MMYARSLLFVLWLYGSMTVCGVVGAPFAAFRTSAAVATARAWARAALFGARWICGIRVQIRGLDKIPAAPVLFAMKHQAMLDTLMPFFLTRSPSIVLKRELLAMPIFGWYARRAGFIPVDREAHAAALKAMLRAARAEYQKGRSIVIFPEGTRQPIGAPPDYKPGVAAIYRDLGAPCVPVALNSGVCWPAHGILRKPGLVTLDILDVIPPGLSREDFMSTLQTRIETASAALLERPQG